MRFLLPKILISVTAFLTFLPSLAFGAEDTPNLENSIHGISLKFVFVAALLIALVVVLTYVIKSVGENLKKLFFVLIVAPTLLVTFYLVGSTIFLNISSSTGGPVHWHADFEIFYCGQKVDLVNPKGLSNKIGTATFHEHNDNRIHVEGVVLNPADVNFGNFVKVIGGDLTQESLTIPTTNGDLTMRNGELCTDGSEAELQAFVYRVEGQNILRNRLYDLPNYILSPAGSVPPGDCIIIEFTRFKERTEHICESYELAILKGRFNYAN